MDYQACVNAGNACFEIWTFDVGVLQWGFQLILVVLTVRLIQAFKDFLV